MRSKEKAKNSRKHLRNFFIFFEVQNWISWLRKEKIVKLRHSPTGATNFGRMAKSKEASDDLMVAYNCIRLKLFINHSITMQGSTTISFSWCGFIFQWMLSVTSSQSKWGKTKATICIILNYYPWGPLES